ncbi:unnamed protein product [Meloidogyne enterolobii]|uniref:Uncharacterized protein n=1 Tax=Meloidogyne enterolobii TaxID=390850 RepID=A0ACB0YMH5_MELEN
MDNNNLPIHQHHLLHVRLRPHVHQIYHHLNPHNDILIYQQHLPHAHLLGQFLLLNLGLTLLKWIVHNAVNVLSLKRVKKLEYCLGFCFIIGFLLFLIPWLFCWVPFVLNCCPSCNKALGRYRRL